MELSEGRVAGELRAEFPGLRLRVARAPYAPVRAPKEVRERLGTLSNRFRGAQAIALRREPVPSAYRVFYRHVGIDPDVQRVPAEEAAVRRLLHGGFRSGSLLDDALLIAVVETGVGVWALDAERVQGELELRPARAGERLGREHEAPEAGEGSLLIADARSPLVRLFAPPDGAVAPRRDTRAVCLYAVQVPGVPDVFAEEALWTCVDLLGAEHAGGEQPPSGG